jgi:branched-subunit amino acid transport protein
MGELTLVAFLTLIVFTIRVSGVFSGGLSMPPIVDRALRFAPVAVIAALTASLLSGQAAGDPIRYLAAAVAAAVMLWSGRLWLCIAAGFAAYWALRALGF